MEPSNGEFVAHVRVTFVSDGPFTEITFASDLFSESVSLLS